MLFDSEPFDSEPVELVEPFDSDSDFSRSDFSLELEALLRPFVEAEDDERESVMYQPLPLNTMPTGWMTLRSAPPQRSQVLNGGSEKLWRFSMTSSQAVHLYVYVGTVFFFDSSESLITQQSDSHK